MTIEEMKKAVEVSRTSGRRFVSISREGDANFAEVKDSAKELKPVGEFPTETLNCRIITAEFTSGSIPDKNEREYRRAMYRIDCPNGQTTNVWVNHYSSENPDLYEVGEYVSLNLNVIPAGSVGFNLSNNDEIVLIAPAKGRTHIYQAQNPKLTVASEKSLIADAVRGMIAKQVETAEA